MRFIYKPFGFVMGLVAALVSRKLFDFIWALLDKEEAPEATTRDVSYAKVMAAAALQGMVFKTTRAVVDREGAKGFNYVTGFWPGEKTPPAP